MKTRGAQCAGYRLPTDAEWEYALAYGTRRGGSDYTLPFSLEDIDEAAWVGANSGGNLKPVAQKKANRWGLYDMLGNVSEWVFDWDEHRYGEDPQHPADEPLVQSNALKITRGGCCTDADDYIRSAAPPRPLDPSTRSPTVGFRVARTAV